MNLALQTLVQGHTLSSQDATALMVDILEGQFPDLQVAAILAILEARIPTADEISGFASALTSRMIPVVNVPENAIDTCGTGGSGGSTLNTSTLSAVVAAGAGATVAKHGNRSASGRCGSMDVLEALGADVDIEPEQVGQLLAEHRFVFVNARKHHPGLGRLAPIRKTLGFRTVFNLLGPMVSPARVKRQLLGVSNPRMAPIMADALAHLGHERSWVVSSQSGLDEIALDSPTQVYEVRNGQVHSWAIVPEEFGLGLNDPKALEGGDVAYNARRFSEILKGEDQGPARDHVALNAGAALVVADVAQDLQDGLKRAQETIRSGKAYETFIAWQNRTKAQNNPRLGTLS